MKRGPVRTQTKEKEIMIDSNLYRNITLDRLNDILKRTNSPVSLSLLRAV